MHDSGQSRGRHVVDPRGPPMPNREYHLSQPRNRQAVDRLRRMSELSAQDDLYLIQDFVINDYYGKDCIDLYVVQENASPNMEVLAVAQRDYMEREWHKKCGIVLLERDAVHTQRIYLLRIEESENNITNLSFLTRSLTDNIHELSLLTIETLVYDVVRGLSEDRSHRQQGFDDLKKGILTSCAEDPATAVMRYPEIVLRAMYLNLEFPHLKFDSHFQRAIKDHFGQTRSTYWKWKRIKLFYFNMEKLVSGRQLKHCVHLAETLQIKPALDQLLVDVCEFLNYNNHEKRPIWITAWLKAKTTTPMSTKFENPVFYDPPDPLGKEATNAWIGQYKVPEDANESESESTPAEPPVRESMRSTRTSSEASADHRIGLNGSRRTAVKPLTSSRLEEFPLRRRPAQYSSRPGRRPPPIKESEAEEFRDPYSSYSSSSSVSRHSIETRYRRTRRRPPPRRDTRRYRRHPSTTEGSSFSEQDKEPPPRSRARTSIRSRDRSSSRERQYRHWRMRAKLRDRSRRRYSDSEEESDFTDWETERRRRYGPGGGKRTSRVSSRRSQASSRYRSQKRDSHFRRYNRRLSSSRRSDSDDDESDDSYSSSERRYRRRPSRRANPPRRRRSKPRIDSSTESRSRSSTASEESSRGRRFRYRGSIPGTARPLRRRNSTQNDRRERSVTRGRTTRDPSPRRGPIRSKSQGPSRRAVSVRERRTPEEPISRQPRSRLPSSVGGVSSEIRRTAPESDSPAPQRNPYMPHQSSSSSSIRYTRGEKGTHRTVSETGVYKESLRSTRDPPMHPYNSNVTQVRMEQDLPLRRTLRSAIDFGRPYQD
eukprot:Protomagalhaensia_sp_Gyna_25__5209@NODE_628_length_2969_cov_7_831399_g487_i0_p1_GENE_NODE_628_length_2969_cov_7_831399_g487_i0NODE_628_length_2969_cov_7_831399_g487_i0_p1_ORF_typecomplete_len823_score93_04ACTL7A_N/PF16840_5/0_37_NODE_628_length_2969_cov_7_831399_g487_i0832551